MWSNYGTFSSKDEKVRRFLSPLETMARVVVT
jgi:hypothetical protein